MSEFTDFVGEPIVSFIYRNGARKILSRVNKSEDHYKKALKLINLDEEMGIIRLIAAEEELVVAIFELIKLKTGKTPEHQDFIGKFRDHRVKLAFYPVLSQFRWILARHLNHGITLEGLESAITWKVMPVVKDNRVLIQIIDENGQTLIENNPLSAMISHGEKNSNEVVEELYTDLVRNIADQLGLTLREFVTSRADYRNKILYSADAGWVSEFEKLQDLIPNFQQTYHDLLWTVAVLMGNDAPEKSWGLVSQFISLYRKVLMESKIIKV